MFRFLKDPGEFSSAAALANSILCLDNEFPEAVFRQKCGQYLFGSSEQLWNPKLWSYIQKINSRLQSKSDDRVLLFALDFSFDKKFYNAFGHYGIVEFSSNATYDEFRAALAQPYAATGTDCLCVSATRLAFVSMSNQWVVWAHRGFEICIACHGAKPEHQRDRCAPPAEREG